MYAFPLDIPVLENRPSSEEDPELECELVPEASWVEEVGEQVDATMESVADQFFHLFSSSPEYQDLSKIRRFCRLRELVKKETRSDASQKANDYRGSAAEVSEQVDKDGLWVPPRITMLLREDVPSRQTC
ncbi:hypothetical protein CYMTET_48186 [Cymbomonas tetramitiformis]|uniref:Uncharacterized protein n=1 Tax=Cymbomonas tetramitiformis TaxID=36881 RepID=A0AAE0EWZ7_9CHLO|nr:hypothetical protein CYMTET_48186 [Cymbomonas tetramitiformis]